MLRECPGVRTQEGWEDKGGPSSLWGWGKQSIGRGEGVAEEGEGEPPGGSTEGARGNSRGLWKATGNSSSHGRLRPWQLSHHEGGQGLGHHTPGSLPLWPVRGWPTPPAALPSLLQWEVSAAFSLVPGSCSPGEKGRLCPFTHQAPYRALWGRAQSLGKHCPAPPLPGETAL